MVALGWILLLMGLGLLIPWPDKVDLELFTLPSNMLSIYYSFFSTISTKLWFHKLICTTNAVLKSSLVFCDNAVFFILM